MKYGKYIILILFGIAMFCFGLIGAVYYANGGEYIWLYDSSIAGIILGWIFSFAGLAGAMIEGIVRFINSRKNSNYFVC